MSTVEHRFILFILLNCAAMMDAMPTTIIPNTSASYKTDTTRSYRDTTGRYNTGTDASYKTDTTRSYKDTTGRYNTGTDASYKTDTTRSYRDTTGRYNTGTDASYKTDTTRSYRDTTGRYNTGTGASYKTDTTRSYRDTTGKYNTGTGANYKTDTTRSHRDTTGRYNTGTSTNYNTSATSDITTPTMSSTQTPRHNDGICATATWAQHGVTVAGGNGWGYELNQLNYPMGIFIDEDQTIYIADTNNARIIKWTEGITSGQIVAGKLGAGSGTAQLNSPMDVVVDKAGIVYITDTTNNRVQKWNQSAQWGETIINIQRPIGIALDDEGSLYISAFYQSQALIKFPKGEKNGFVIASNLPDLYYFFVNQNRSIYAADMSNGEIVKLDEMKTQISVVIGGFQSFGVPQLSLPSSVVVDQAGAVYVTEYGNNRVTRWLPGAKSGIVIAGSSSQGYQSDQLALPTDIAFDIDGNLYVADTGNHRVQKFVIDKSSCQ